MNFKKVGLFVGVILAATAALTSCTKSFCTVSDKASMLYSYEKYEAGQTYAEGTKTKEIVESAKKQGLLTPSTEFNAFIEGKIDDYAKELVAKVYSVDTKKYPADLFDYSYARGVALFAGGEDIEKNKLWYITRSLFLTKIIKVY